MHISLNYLLNYDYFYVQRFIVDHVTVSTGSSAVASIVEKVCSRNYMNYFDNSICQAEFTFTSKEKADLFAQLLSEFDLKKEFTNLSFYETLQGCLVYAQDQNFQFKSSYLKDKTAALFKPKVNDKTVCLCFPNSHVLYIDIEGERFCPSLQHLNNSVLKGACEALMGTLVKTKNFMQFREFKEMDNMQGSRFASFVILDDRLYFISDLGFEILNQVESIANKIYAINNVDVINESIDEEGFKAFLRTI